MVEGLGEVDPGSILLNIDNKRLSKSLSFEPEPEPEPGLAPGLAPFTKNVVIFLFITSLLKPTDDISYIGVIVEPVLRVIIFERIIESPALVTIDVITKTLFSETCFDTPSL